MKESLFLLPIAVFYLAVESTLFPNMPLPDVPLLFVFFMAWRRPGIEGVLLAFALGYIDDAFNGGVIGSTSFALALVFLSAHLLSKRIHFSTPVARAAGAGGLRLLKGLFMYLVLKSAGLKAGGVPRLFFEILLTAAFAPFAIALLNRLCAFINPHAYKDSAN